MQDVTDEPYDSDSTEEDISESMQHLNAADTAIEHIISILRDIRKCNNSEEVILKRLEPWLALAEAEKRKKETEGLANLGFEVVIEPPSAQAIKVAGANL